MNLDDIIENKFHGLPGIGVNGQNGQKGMKGQSVYVGYLRSFFDGIALTDKEYGYIRIKNQKEQTDSSKADYYYRSDGNFYRKIYGVDDSLEEMVKFTIYNLKGVYFKNVPTNVTKSETWTSLGADDSFYQNRKANIGDALGFRYNSIGKAETIDDIAFGVKVSKEYLDQRDYNNSKTNYSNAITPDIFLSTNLKSMYHSGDILYIQDDLTGNIINFVVLTDELVGCSFEKFLEQEFISIDALSSTFNGQNDRVSLKKKLSIPSIEISQKLQSINKNGLFQKNFISSNPTDAQLSIEFNDTSTNNDFIQFNTSSGRLGFSKSDDGIFRIESGNKISFSNIFVSSDIQETNIDFPNYGNSEFIFVDESHIPSIDVDNIIIKDNGIEIKVNGLDFVSSNSESYRFGIELYQKDSSMGLYKQIIKSEQSVSENLDVDVDLSEIFIETGIYNLGVVNYAYGIGTAKYYSNISNLILDYDASLGIQNYTFEQNKSSFNVFDEFSNDYFDFAVTNLSCGKSDDVNISIKCIDSSISIKDVYFNNIQIIKDSDVVSTDKKVSSWLHINENTEINISENGIDFSKISVDSNIPELVKDSSVIVSDSIYDYFYHLTKDVADLYPIGSERLKETLERTIYVGIVFYNDGNIQKVNIPVTQNGLNGLFPSLGFEFSENTLSNKIEETNKSENGVLCNQIQTFTDLRIKNFTEYTWGKYLDNPKLDVIIDFDRNTEKSKNGYYYTKDVNLNNVQIYSKNDILNYSNNAIKADFGWTKESVDFKSIDRNSIKETFSELDIIVSDSGNNTIIDDIKGWIPITEDLCRNETYIPKGINFYINTSSTKLNSLSINDNKVSIYSMFEVANPIPMEFNLKWKIVGYRISGKLKDEFITEESEAAETFIFEKDLESKSVYSDEKFYSDNLKFIINPVSLIMNPEDSENQTLIRGAIKKVGSEDGGFIRAELQQLDSDILSEYEAGQYSDFYKRQCVSKTLGGVSEIGYYQPKVKYLQDNIVNFSIVSKALDTSLNNDFIKTNDELLKERSNLKNNFNIYPIDTQVLKESKNTDKYAQNYIRIQYDADCMNPETRNEGKTFYYNNQLYDYDKFNQVNTISPLWTSFNMVSEIVDSKIQLAKQTWNFEYEVSKEYNQKSIFGGVLTKSGNGYSFLSESFDEGQYTSDGIYSLSELKEKSEDAVLSESFDFEMLDPDGFIHQPSKGEFFRSFVQHEDWVFPYFFIDNNENKVYPYYITNPYLSRIDSEIMLKLKDSSTIVSDIKDFIQNGLDEIGNVQDETCSDYIERKVETTVFIKEKDDYVSEMNDTEKLNMLIPYNLLFDIYPRTMYNTDMGPNVMNILMLKQPCISRENNYRFDKRYYESEKGYSDLLPPWNVNK